MCLTPIKLGKVAKPLKISGSTRLMDLGSGVVTESYKVKPPRLIPGPIGKVNPIAYDLLDLGSGIMNDDFDEWYWPTFDF